MYETSQENTEELSARSQISSDMMRVTSIARSLSKLVRNLNYLTAIIENFNKDFVKSQVAKYRNTSSPFDAIKKLRDSQLIAAINDTVSDDLTKVSIKVGKEISLEEVFSLSDSEFLNLILKEPLNFLFNAKSSDDLTKDQVVVLNKVYKAFQTLILAENTRSGMSAQEKEKQNLFFFIAELTQEIKIWIPRVLEVVALYINGFNATCSKWASAFSINFEENLSLQELNSAVIDLSKHFSIFEKYNQKFQHDSKVMLRADEVNKFSFSAHPFNDLVKKFLPGKKWSDPFDLADVSLVRWITIVINEVAKQLESLHQLKVKSSFYTKFYELLEVPLKTAASSPDHSSNRNLARLGSQAEFASPPRRITRTRSRSVDVGRGGFFSSLFQKDKPETTNNLIIVPKVNPQKNNNFEQAEECLKVLNNEQGFLPPLLKLLENFAKSTKDLTDFFEKTTETNSYWIADTFKKLLEKARPEVQRLYWLVIANVYFFAYVSLGDYYTLVLTEEPQKLIEKDIQDLKDQTKIGPKFQKESFIKFDYSAISLGDILQPRGDNFPWNDKAFCTTLNAYQMPSQEMGRHPLEIPTDELIKFAVSLNQNGKDIVDFSSFWFNFNVSTLGTMVLRLNYCYKILFNFWFLFNQLAAELTSTNLPSASEFEKSLGGFSGSIGNLMDIKLGKTMMQDFFAEYKNEKGNKFVMALESILGMDLKEPTLKSFNVNLDKISSQLDAKEINNINLKLHDITSLSMKCTNNFLEQEKITEIYCNNIKKQILPTYKAMCNVTNKEKIELLKERLELLGIKREELSLDFVTNETKSEMDNSFNHRRT